MLENWVWNVDGLKALLGTNDDPIPKDLLASLINSRIANAGLFYSRQILLASFDQAIHTTNWEVSLMFFGKENNRFLMFVILSFFGLTSLILISLSL